MTGLIGAALLGIVLGARHALEPDHLAAIGVLGAEHPSGRRGALLGAAWGAGHTLSLLAVAGILALLATQLPESLTTAFELAVAAMLVGLGARAVARSIRDADRGPMHTHEHGSQTHTHTGPAAHTHLGRWTLATRPLLVGMLHGLAGSGALTALAVARMSTREGQVLFAVLFGLGSIVAMAAVSAIAGALLARLERARAAARIALGVAGAASAIVGVAWAWTAVA